LKKIDELLNELNIDIPLPWMTVDACIDFLNLKEPQLLTTKKWIKSAKFPYDDIVITHNSKLFGLGFRQETKEHVSDDWPHYLVESLASPGYDNIRREALTKIDFSLEVDSIFHLFHPHMRLYGHFLIEGLYKLFLYADLTDKFTDIPPLYLNESSPNFIKNWVNELVAPKYIYSVKENQNVKANQVLDFKFHNNYIWSNRVRNLIYSYGLNVGGSRDIQKYKKIFISRRNVNSLTSFRHLSNEKALESIAIENGYQVISPEKLELKEQVTLFNNAEYIVGEYGSALHNAIFSRPNTSFLCFNHINTVQQSLAKKLWSPLDIYDAREWNIFK